MFKAIKTLICTHVVAACSFGLFSIPAQASVQCRHFTGYGEIRATGPDLKSATNNLREACLDGFVKLKENRTGSPVDPEYAATEVVDACINITCD